MINGQAQLFPTPRAEATSRDDDRRFTPSVIPQAIERLCGRVFDLDVAAESTPGGHVCPQFFSSVDDGLSRSWATSGMVWCNPPFSVKDQWIEKVHHEVAAGSTAWLWLPFTADVSRQELAARADGLVIAAWRVEYASPCGSRTDSPGPVVQAGFGFGLGRKVGVWQVWENGDLTPVCAL